MYTKLILAIALIVSSLGVSNAQQDSARLRVMQLSFVPAVSATINITFDEQPVFENLSFPFTTDYADFPAGNHTLTTTIVDVEEATATHDMTLEAGHQYSLIVEGDYSEDAVRFILIDETELLTDQTGSIAIVVNLTPVAMNLFIEDEIVVEELATENYDFFALPLNDFTVFGSFASTSDEPIEIGTYTALPNTVVLGVARQTDDGDLQTITHLATDLTIADYLQTTIPDTYFHISANALISTDTLDLLSADDTYTLFLPSNDVFEDVAIEDFTELMSNHIISENMPPTILPQHETLTSIAGDTIALQFSDTDSTYWEIEGAPILWDVRLSNGTLYVIDGVIVANN